MAQPSNKDAAAAKNNKAAATNVQATTATNDPSKVAVVQLNAQAASQSKAGAPVVGANTSSSKGAAGKEESKAAASGSAQPGQQATSQASAAQGKANAPSNPANGASLRDSTSPQKKTPTAAAGGKSAAPTAAAAGGKSAGSQKPAPVVPSKPVISAEEQKQLEQMRTSIEDKRKARTVAQDTLQDMTQLVSLKKQLDSQQGHVAVSIKNQDAENSKLEQQLIDIQLKVKQEELIKELNTLKSGKKSDAILTTAMKDQEKAVAKLIADGGAEEGKLDQQVEELLRQIKRTIPDQIHKVESETQLLKAQKSKISRETTVIKDKINGLSVDDAQLQGKAALKIATQINPASKVAIEESDIQNYADEIDKISRSLTEVWRLLPCEMIPENSPAQPSHLSSPDKSAGKSSPFPSPSPNKDFLKNLTGSNIFAKVQEKAKEAALAIQKDKHEFVVREQQRRSFLEQDKLTSMKRIVKYEGEIEAFPARQHDLMTQISANKSANKLVQECLNGVFNDKKEMHTLREQLKTEQEAEQEHEEGEDELEEDQGEGFEELEEDEDPMTREGEEDEEDFTDDQVAQAPEDDQERDFEEEEEDEEVTPPNIKGDQDSILVEAE